jgi:hypothetical protein
MCYFTVTVRAATTAQLNLPNLITVETFRYTAVQPAVYTAAQTAVYNQHQQHTHYVLMHCNTAV